MRMNEKRIYHIFFLQPLSSRARRHCVCIVDSVVFGIALARFLIAAHQRDNASLSDAENCATAGNTRLK